MPIMCYEQFIKKLFKTKNSQSTHELKKSVQSDRLPRKRVNIDDKKGVDSDSSFSSSSTCVKYLDSDNFSLRSSWSMHSSVCKNCAQSVDLQSFRRHYAEYLSPQKTTVTVTNINLPPSVHRPLQMDLPIDYSKIYAHQKRRRTWNHIKNSLTDNVERPESSISGHKYSYQYNKTFHSPPPNRNPFDLDPDIR